MNDTRQRLIIAMTDALRRRGLHGSGLTELLAAADAPKGVMYHHFPGGKTELAIAAIEATVANLCAGLEKRLGNGDPAAALVEWIAHAQKRLDASDYEHGCPLATIALETTNEDGAIRAALAAGFAAIRERIAASLVLAGYETQRADALAALIVAAYEGGLLQARVAASTAPMALVSMALVSILNGAKK